MRVLVFGTFDHLHPGHLYFLSEASKRGVLHVVIALDETVERIKGRAPDQTAEERMKAITKEFSDAHVLLGDPSDYLNPIRLVQPDLIMLGYDQKLPPGVMENDLPCPVERLGSFEPKRYKSSFLRGGEEEKT